MSASERRGNIKLRLHVTSIIPFPCAHISWEERRATDLCKSLRNFPINAQSKLLLVRPVYLQAPGTTVLKSTWMLVSISFHCNSIILLR